MLLVVAIFPTLASWLYFVVWADRPWMRTLYVGAKAVQALLPLAGIALGVRRARRQDATMPARGRGALLGLATGASLGGAVLLAWLGPLRGWGPLAAAPARVLQRLHALGVESFGAYLVLAVLLSVAHALFEEYYWRWFLFGELERRMRGDLAVLLASLAFAAHHFIVVDTFLGGAHRLDAALPFTLLVAAAGALWCWLFRRSGSLISPWLSHLLVDGALMVVGWRMVAAAMR